jgi:hypothetical protein
MVCENTYIMSHNLCLLKIRYPHSHGDVQRDTKAA